MKDNPDAVQGSLPLEVKERMVVNGLWARSHAHWFRNRGDLDSFKWWIRAARRSIRLAQGFNGGASRYVH